MVGGDYDSTSCNISVVTMVSIRLFWSEGTFSRDVFQESDTPWE
jgi:hypothetical protein